MKALGGLLGLMAALAVVLLLLEAQHPGGLGQDHSSENIIDAAGVRADLFAIAQAERRYLARHGTYASIAELQSGGYLGFSGKQRRGYRFEAQFENGSRFRVTAFPLRPDPALHTLTIDETLQITHR